MKRPSLLALVLLLFAAGFSLGETAPIPAKDGVPAGREDATQRVRAGIARLNALYWSPTLNIWLDRPGDDLRANYEGRCNPPWWPSANAVEMLIDFMTATGTADYDATLESLYELQKDHPGQRARVVEELKRRHQWSEADEQAWVRASQKPRETKPATDYYSNFQNEYLDDSAWWAIAWLKMYDRTHTAKYLTTARVIHAHMARNWKPEKGGGVIWCEDEDKQRPNTITNNLFLILSARLYQRTHEEAYLGWAEKTLEWVRTNALYDGVGVVDGPGHRGDYWGYNQGAYLGALIALYEATGRQEYLNEAVKVADTVLHRSGLTLPGGILIEKLGTNGDACLFKGILVRYLAQLRDALRVTKLQPEAVQEIDRCIRTSMESMLQHGVGADGLFSAEWHEGAKDRRTNFNSQVSALIGLTAALQ